MQKMPDNSVDSIVSKNACILYGIYDIMGLWKHFGKKLKKLIPVGYGLAQIMVLGTVKFVLKVRSIIPIAFLTSGQKVKYLKVIRLTTYVECQLVATQTTWKLLHRKLISTVAIQQSHILLKLIV